MESCNIKWNAFSEHMSDFLFQMQNSNYLTDITLVCDDKKKLNAHKLVLGVCSKVFQDFIKDLPDGLGSVIYLRGIQYIEMRSILEFMYTGKTQIERIHMKKLFDVASNLEVVEICRFMESIGGHKNENFYDIQEQSEDTVDVVKDLDDSKEISEESIDEEDNQLEEGVKASFEDYVSKNDKPQKKCKDNNFTERKFKAEQSQKETKKVKVLCNTEQFEIKDSKFLCSVCDYQTKDNSNMRKHIRSLHNKEKFSCSTCENTYYDQSSLKKHIKSVHEGVKYACDQCDFEATQNPLLKFHIQSTHFGIRYACGQCKFEAKYPQQLKNHSRVKHEGQQYTCDKCQFKSTYKNVLKKHMKSKHKGTV